VRDGIELERRGIPTVTISWERFEAAARAQAKELGMAQLPLAVIRETRLGETREDLRRKAEQVLDAVIGSLTSREKGLGGGV